MPPPHPANDSFAEVLLPDCPARTACTKTLKWINARRTANGQKPIRRLPKGIRHDMRKNPVALGITSCNAGIAAIQRDGQTDIWFLPSPVITFLQLFHDGLLPDLERD